MGQLARLMLDNFDAVAKLIEMNKQFRKIIKELVANVAKQYGDEYS